ncbi:hypothetical protein ACHAWF_002550 [Thalassiosira exigua]
MALLLLRSLLLLSLAAPPAAAFRLVANAPPTPAPAAGACARRDALRRGASSCLGFLAAAAASAPVVAPASAGAAVLRAPGRCANGEGDGCDALAGENDLVRELQRKSAENREANQREALNAYYMKNYPDVFAVSDKRMVKKPDGSFALYTAEEVAELVRDGKVGIEYPKSKGGRIADLTQKPILVLSE